MNFNQVGSGKSSLLSALLGEMGRSGGVANVRGEVAFVAQQVLRDVDVDVDVEGDVEGNENDDRVGGGRGLRGRDSDGGDCDQSVGQSVFVLQHALCPPSAPKLFTRLIFFRRRGSATRL